MIEVRAPSSPVNRVEGDPLFSMFSHLQSGSPICTRRRCETISVLPEQNSTWFEPVTRDQYWFFVLSCAGENYWAFRIILPAFDLTGLLSFVCLGIRSRLESVKDLFVISSDLIKKPMLGKISEFTSTVARLN